MLIIRQNLITTITLQKKSKNAQEVGFPRPATITKPMVQKILKRSEIKPFKIKYYCEKCDPEFKAKMHDVLLIYKQISLQFHEDGSIIIPQDGVVVHTVFCDEKPGIQAIATTGEGLRPTAGKGCVYRDAEYKRLGTLSLLAGETIPLVSESHKSSDFINLLKNLDIRYPEGEHSSRTGREGSRTATCITPLECRLRRQSKSTTVFAIQVSSMTT